MFLVDENLGNGPRSVSLVFHFLAGIGIHEHVDFVERRALPFQKRLRARAVWTDRCRVDLDLRHGGRLRCTPQHSHTISLANGRTTRASAKTKTFSAPARFSARAQASTVAPVVNTSSIGRMFRPAMADLWPGEILNAPRILRRLALAEGIAPWLGVERPRRRASKLAGLPDCRASERASSADWL